MLEIMEVITQAQINQDHIFWCNSEAYTIGDLIKVNGKTGIVLETIHQYVKTDIPGQGWIDVVSYHNTVRGVPKICGRCKHSCGYSGGPYYCDLHKTDHVENNDTCAEWKESF